MKVGLTGGIASGKTTCTNYLHDRYAIPIIDADIIAREIVAVGTPALSKLSQALGRSILQNDGSLNRPVLRNLIQTNAEIKQLVDDIMHPLIYERIMELARLQVSVPYIVLSIPLLFETGWEKQVDLTVVIDVPQSVQIARLMERDQCTHIQSEKMLKVQTDRNYRIIHSNYIIQNHATKDILYKQLDELHKTILKL